MSKFLRSPYWICQLAGWGTVAVYWFYFSLQHLSVPQALLDVGISVVSMIVITDGYRRLVHHKNWLRLPPVRLLSIMVIAYLVLVGFYMLQAYLTYKIKVGGPYTGSIALGAFAGGSRYLAIWLLAFHLYHYARQSAEQRAVIAESQLARLSNDLNPHFLFNALNGIKALTREDPALARTAIDRLAALLRYSLKRSPLALVPLPEELRIIEEYVALEQIRLEERLVMDWQIPEYISDCQIPPLSLHTLVENAVKHGVARLPSGGSILVRLKETADYWVFTVQNPRFLIPSPRTSGRAQKEVWQEEQDAGTGLLNLHQRLRLQYGDRASLTLHETGKTVTATLQLPR